MRVLRTTLVVLSAVLIAAHYLREGTYPLVLLSLAFPLLLLADATWANRVVEALLVLAGVEWVRTIVALVGEREAMGRPYTAATAILGVAAALTLAAAISVEVASKKRRPRRGRP